MRLAAFQWPIVRGLIVGALEIFLIPCGDSLAVANRPVIASAVANYFN